MTAFLGSEGEGPREGGRAKAHFTLNLPKAGGHAGGR